MPRDDAFEDIGDVARTLVRSSPAIWYAQRIIDLGDALQQRFWNNRKALETFLRSSPARPTPPKPPRPPQRPQPPPPPVPPPPRPTPLPPPAASPLLSAMLLMPGEGLMDRLANLRMLGR